MDSAAESGELARTPSDFLTGEEIQSLTAMLKRLSELNTDGRIGRLFAPAQLDLLEKAIFSVKGTDSRGNGAVEIQIRDGRIIGISETRWLK